MEAINKYTLERVEKFNHLVLKDPAHSRNQFFNKPEQRENEGEKNGL